jgi:hypothetical protein
MAAAGFSVTDAAFTGFRIVWERPLAVVYWAALQVVVALASTAFVTLSAGRQFTEAAQASLQFGADPAPMIARMAALAPTYAALLIGGLVLQAVLAAAMNRAVLRPQLFRFGYLRLAADELRQLGLFALILLLAAALYIGVVLVVGVIFALLGFAGGDAGFALALLILIPVLLVVFVFVGVRLSLASALTFASRRIDLFGSWTLTRGRFWPLLWTYLIAFALSLVVWTLTLAIALFAVAILGGGFGALGVGAEPDLGSLATAFAPAHVLYLAITAAGQALGLPVTMTPPASVYKAVTGGAATAARVFD